jgi:hypothetical protein
MQWFCVLMTTQYLCFDKKLIVADGAVQPFAWNNKLTLSQLNTIHHTVTRRLVMPTSRQSFVSCSIHQSYHVSSTEHGGRLANTPSYSEVFGSRLDTETDSDFSVGLLRALDSMLHFCSLCETSINIHFLFTLYHYVLPTNWTSSCVQLVATKESAGLLQYCNRMLLYSIM